ncbi:FBP domain-containing protein [Streptomyces sp. SDr-06]|uniref:FBP domain-containing protein n=1 Tax=Streptomyces sp. SDr-06 TaxID=2267702 RepID=UPI000DEA0EAC|nr:FBP domain-containing protein [Streptomyces sp. SDr-06]RCH61729.1 FBP domain-containing protein [Streptomyces sp. SDr-06]
MKAVTEREIRASFINCSKGEAARLAVPRELDSLPWDDLDFLGWREPSAPDRANLVTEHGGRLTAVALRFASRQRGPLQRSMCSVCLTTHAGSGVSLMTARLAGRAGREGNSVGIYLCTDLACSLYLRGKKVPEGIGGRFEESLTPAEQVERARGNLAGFLAKVGLPE